MWKQKTFVTASTSRRKQQAELLARAVLAATLQKEEARRTFHLTTCSILELAAAEAVFVSKDHRTGEDAQGEDGGTHYSVWLHLLNLQFVSFNLCLFY